MGWEDLLANGYVKPHKTSRKEIEDLWALVDRDLADAAIKALSDDRRFATAYNAALQISKIAIAASGYRLAKGPSAHFNSFETVRTAIPTEDVARLADYFDTCRRKRNHIDYDGTDIVTQTETDEIIKRTLEYRDLVRTWLSSKHPELISNVG